MLKRLSLNFREKSWVGSSFLLSGAKRAANLTLSQAPDLLQGGMRVSNATTATKLGISLETAEARDNQEADQVADQVEEEMVEITITEEEMTLEIANKDQEDREVEVGIDPLTGEDEDQAQETTATTEEEVDQLIRTEKLDPQAMTGETNHRTMKEDSTVVTTKEMKRLTIILTRSEIFRPKSCHLRLKSCSNLLAFN